MAFGAAANLCAFYHPMSGTTVGAFKGDLSGYETRKGTIRSHPDKPLPAALVRRLVKARVEENAARLRE